MAGAEDDLRQGYGDDVARWKGVREVKGGRVTKVNWAMEGLEGTPELVGELDALTELWLNKREIGDLNGVNPKRRFKGLTSVNYAQILLKYPQAPINL